MGLLGLVGFGLATNESTMGAVLPITLMTIICLPGSALVVIWILIGVRLFNTADESFMKSYILAPGPDPVSDVIWHVVVLTIVGILQWFVVVPFLKKKMLKLGAKGYQSTEHSKIDK